LCKRSDGSRAHIMPAQDGRGAIEQAS
jgi:hypothetical protein